MAEKDSEKAINRMMAEADRLWKLEEKIRKQNPTPEEKPQDTVRESAKPGTYLDFIRRCVQLGTISDFPGENQFDAVARQFDIVLGADILRAQRNDKRREDFEKLTPEQQVALLAWRED